MPRVNVSPTKDLPTHDVSLSDGIETIGLIFERDISTMQEIPISENARQWNREQKAWFGGMGKNRFDDDPNGFFDSYGMWTNTEGKLFPMPQWFYGKGFRDADFSMPGEVEYRKVDQYISIKFTAGQTYNAARIMLWLDWVGSPSTLAWGLYNDNAGDPGTVIESGTLAIADATREGPSRLTMASTHALTSGVDYHVKIYHAGGENYWRVATDADGAGSLVSSDDSAWSAAVYSMYYRVEDSTIRRQWKLFEFKESLYAVSIRESGANSELLINGDRFKATSSTGTTVSDTSSGVATSWVTDQWAGAYIRIWRGTGAGQVRLISSNTSTQITVSEAWDVNPDTTSECVIYGTPIWQELSAGLGLVTGAPAVAGRLVHFPQGDTDYIKDMNIDYTNANQHAFRDNGTNNADLLVVFWNPTNEAEVWRADVDLAKISRAKLVSYGSNLNFKTWKRVGFPTTNITNMIDGMNLSIFKEDGIWNVTPTYTILPFRTDLSSAKDVSNGAAAFISNQELWFTWSHSIQRQIGDDVSDMLLYRAGTQGLNRPGIPRSAVAGIGWKFFAIDGERNSLSSILCFNGMGWQEIFRGWHTSARIQNVYWKANPGTRSQLWFDVNGELVYIDYPLYAANPLNDSGLTYQHYSTLTTSTFDANEITLHKLIDSVRLNLDDESSEVFIEWQTNEQINTDIWYPLGELKNLQQDEFKLNLGNVQGIRLRFRIYTTTATAPPIIQAYEISGWIFQKLKYSWVSSFHVSEYQVTNDGAEDFKPDYVYNFLRNAHEKGLALTLRSVSPTMDDKKVIVSAPAAHKTWIRAESGKPTWEGVIDVQFRET